MNLYHYVKTTLSAFLHYLCVGESLVGYWSLFCTLSRMNVKILGIVSAFKALPFKCAISQTVCVCVWCARVGELSVCVLKAWLSSSAHQLPYSTTSIPDLLITKLWSRSLGHSFVVFQMLAALSHMHSCTGGFLVCFCSYSEQSFKLLGLIISPDEPQVSVGERAESRHA